MKVMLHKSCKVLLGIYALDFWSFFTVLWYNDICNNWLTQHRLYYRRSGLCMDKTQFTFLGESGSGKTCYLLGMYNEMAAGIKGYSISAQEDLDIRLQNMYDRLFDNTLEKSERFPAPSDQNTTYNFKVQYGYKDIFDFDWIDYRGGILRSKDEDEYNELKNFLRDSDVIYICIDGEKLKGDNERAKRRAIHRDVADINKLIADYQRNNQILPPIIIIITKYDVCCKDTNKNEIVSIIKKELNILFIEETSAFITIIPVSLGSELADADDLLVEPLNIHLPVLIGVYFAMLNKKKRLEEALMNFERQFGRGDMPAMEGSPIVNSVLELTFPVAYQILKWYLGNQKDQCDIKEKIQNADRARADCAKALQDLIQHMDILLREIQDAELPSFEKGAQLIEFPNFARR